MENYEQDLQENLIARLCHDLANDLGSLQLGLDNLIDVTKKIKVDPLQEKITNGLKRSTSSALAKHAFYRLAYGNKSCLADISFIDLKKTVDKLNQHVGLTFTFDKSYAEYIFSASDAKLFLNLYGLASEMLPYGGQVHLMEGELISLELHAKDIIAFKKETKISPRTVHFHYCERLAKAHKSRVLVKGENPAILTLVAV